jgi:hypothetical protein
VTGYFIDIGIQVNGERDGPGTVMIRPNR